MGKYYNYAPAVTDHSGENYANMISSVGSSIAGGVKDYKAKKEETDRMRTILEQTPGVTPEMLAKFESGSSGAKSGIFSTAITAYHKQAEEEEMKRKEAHQMRMENIRGQRQQPEVELSAPAIRQAEDGSSWYVNPRTGSQIKQVPMPEGESPAPMIREQAVLDEEGNPTKAKIYLDQEGKPVPPQYVQPPDENDPANRPKGQSLGEWEAARRRRLKVKSNPEIIQGDEMMPAASPTIPAANMPLAPATVPLSGRLKALQEGF